MPEPFERRAAPLLLGAGGCLAAASALFSNGSSDSRLVWLGLAALTLAAVLGAGVLVGLPRPAPRREALVALALGWALLGKAFPALGSESGRIARLSSPVGYWNALALLFDMALPLALW